LSHIITWFKSPNSWHKSLNIKRMIIQYNIFYQFDGFLCHLWALANRNYLSFAFWPGNTVREFEKSLHVKLAIVLTLVFHGPMPKIGISSSRRAQVNMGINNRRLFDFSCKTMFSFVWFFRVRL